MLSENTPFECELSIHTLGSDSGNLSLQQSKEHRHIATQMVQQAKRSLHIVSRYLDKSIYDHTDFIEAVSQLARRSKSSRIMILAHDTLPAVQSGHRLIELNQRLSSYVQIRRIDASFMHYNEAFLITDEIGLIHRPLSDRYDGIANFNAPLKSRDLLKLFMKIWDQSPPDTQVRRLYL